MLWTDSSKPKRSLQLRLSFLNARLKYRRISNNSNVFYHCLWNCLQMLSRNSNKYANHFKTLSKLFKSSKHLRLCCKAAYKSFHFDLTKMSQTPYLNQICCEMNMWWTERGVNWYGEEWSWMKWYQTFEIVQVRSHNVLRAL